VIAEEFNARLVEGAWEIEGHRRNAVLSPAGAPGFWRLMPMNGPTPTWAEKFAQ